MTGHLTESKYVLTFLVLSVFVFVTGAGFMVVTCIFMRKHSKAAISRVCISEAAYDNPTYKVSNASEYLSQGPQGQLILALPSLALLNPFPIP